MIEQSIRTEELRECAENLLLQVGVPCNLKGFEAFTEAIILCAEDRDAIQKMTTVVYPEVAKRMGNGNTASRVERAMRHATETVFSRCDYETLTHYFGNSVSLNKGKATNSEFIARMALEVNRRMKGGR